MIVLITLFRLIISKSISRFFVRFPNSNKNYDENSNFKILSNSSQTIRRSNCIVWRHSGLVDQFLKQKFEFKFCTQNNIQRQSYLLKRRGLRRLAKRVRCFDMGEFSFSFSFFMLRNFESQLIFYNNFEMQKQYKSGNFVQKLQDLLQNETYADIITWDSNKTSIDVLDIRRMETQIIPKYFRQQKFESFVRQLNLYGFRKIKFQGRHRFTHPLLLNGQQLTSITSFKCPKSTKGSKQTVESPCSYFYITDERPNSHVLFNSREIAKQQQPLNQRSDNLLRRDTANMQRVTGNTIMIIPANYFQFWSYMQLIGAQNLTNFASVGPVISQQ